MSELLIALGKFFLSNWLALLALVVSITALYFTHLRSFSPAIRDAGRVAVTKNPHDISKSAFIADLMFTNSGAQPGVVNDVALSVKSPAGATALFRSFSEITDRTLQYAEALQPLKSEPLIAFTVDGSKSLLKRIMFVPYDAQADPGLLLGTYSIKIYALTSKDNAWREYGIFTVSLDQDDLNVLGQITATRQADGRLFINWKTREKTTEESKERLKLLESQLSNHG